MFHAETGIPVPLLFRMNMKKKDLEIALEKLRPFEKPSAKLEQYPTPSKIASDILFSAYAEGNVAGKTVCDLGCGTGIFGIGAKLLGAEKVYACDVSADALAIAEKNASDLNLNINFEKCDVSDFSEKCDTVFMNPPFGCQNKHADRPFLEKAMEISEIVYSVHMSETLDFLKDFVSSRGREITSVSTYKYNIPHTFTFHSKTKQTVDVMVVSIR